MPKKFETILFPSSEFVVLDVFPSGLLLSAVAYVSSVYFRGRVVHV